MSNKTKSVHECPHQPDTCEIFVCLDEDEGHLYQYDTDQDGFLIILYCPWCGERLHAKEAPK